MIVLRLPTGAVAHISQAVRIRDSVFRGRFCRIGWNAHRLGLSKDCPAVLLGFAHRSFTSSSYTVLFHSWYAQLNVQVCSEIFFLR